MDRNSKVLPFDVALPLTWIKQNGIKQMESN